jgi:hypothetical protein
MTFFDRKEQVIELTLTKFGRHLYSSGKLKAAHYAFFDDDILYDTNHAGFSENPSSANTRIKRSTRIKPLSSRVGSDRKVKLRTTARQVSDEKRGLLTNRIGNSDPLTDYQPSWDVYVARGSISSNAQSSQVVWKVSSGTKETIESENIPQINLQDLTCSVKPVEVPDRMANLYGKIFPDGTALTLDMSSGELVINIGEANSPESFDNFDIELFEIEEVEDNNIQGTSSDKHYREELRPLFFEKKSEGIVDDILLGDGRDIINDMRTDPSYASYFLNIETDSQIPRDVVKSSFAGSRLGGKGNLRGRNSNILIEDNTSEASRDYETSKFATLTMDEIAQIPLRNIEATAKAGSEESDVSQEDIYEVSNPTGEPCDEGDTE